MVTSQIARRVFAYGGLFIIFLAVGVLYTWPVLPDFLAHQRVPGRGSDEIPMPLFIWMIRDIATNYPHQLLNGALYSPQIGAPYGFLFWIPYMDRIYALVSWPFLSPEAATAAYSVFFTAVNGVFGFWVGRVYGLRPAFAFLVGFGLAVNPFVYHRAQVHPGLNAIFPYAILFAFLWKVRLAQSYREFCVSGLLLSGVALGPFYFSIAVLSLLPLPLVYMVWKAPRRRWLGVTLSLLPLALALGWIRAVTPLGPQHQISKIQGVHAGRSASLNTAGDTLTYSTRPIEYLAGYLDPGLPELNPLRKWITQRVLKLPNVSDYIHEHSTGVRWVVLFFGALAIWSVWKKRVVGGQRHLLLMLLIATLWAYWCSLSPRSLAPLGIGIGPSKWINLLIPQVRAPNRWAPAAALGVTLTAWVWLQSWLRSRDRSSERLVLAVVTVIFVLEYLPPLKFPTSAIPHAFAQEPGASCGVGIILPVFATDSSDAYRQVTRVRGTDCRIVNFSLSVEQNQVLVTNLAAGTEVSVSARAKVLNGLGVQWIAVEGELASVPFAQRLCQEMGFQEGKLPVHFPGTKVSGCGTGSAQISP